MEKFFNTSGPIKAEDHYSLDPLARIDWDEVNHLIASERYFVLHAPRQTGKTSALLAMMNTLNASGDYACVYANIEGAQGARGDSVKGINAVCDVIAGSIRLYLKDQKVFDWLNRIGREQSTQDKLRQLLVYWAEHTDKPTVLLLDEVDALVGDTLISLLRQIRAGYAQRPEAFPQSILLCGVRDVRDYRMHQSDGEVITGGSAFNIKAESLRMGNFNEDETRALIFQHMIETGQRFEAAIFPELWLDSKGQPWLVNALGYEMTWKHKPSRDRKTLITIEHYRQARERLIYSRATHLDQLADKLQEPRVHSVISAMLAGDDQQTNINPHDIEYVVDLGLITASRTEGLAISNRIYQEVIPRELTWATQVTIVNQQQAWYLTLENRLDMPKLLGAFVQFFRENSDIWIEKFNYKEAAPQLIMQAFLQRIVNGGGRINREYALGRKRTDLLIEWPIDKVQGFYGEVQRIVVELKIQHTNLDKVIHEGIEQTKGYADTVGAEEAYLLIFNRTPNTPWEEKVWQQEIDGVLVFGC